MRRKIYYEGMEINFHVDEASTEGEMRDKCSLFFKNSHGSRETFTIHRGQLIVRSTDRHATGGSIRRTSVFLFLLGSDDKDDKDDKTRYPYLSCVSAGTDVGSIPQAKRFIDCIIDKGRYVYGMNY